MSDLHVPYQGECKPADHWLLAGWWQRLRWLRKGRS